MAITRKPFQGVLNIIRFNLHMYIGTMIIFILLVAIKSSLPFYLGILTSVLLIFSFITLIITLITSYYIYDFSNLYDFKWFPDTDKHLNIVNIHAGFDETSNIIIEKYKNSNIQIFDFYDPEKHTELSIQIARKKYPVHPLTQKIQTNNIPLVNSSTDLVFIIFAAHEIRNTHERVLFMKEVKRLTKPEGQVFILEHLRDVNNFFVYNIGFFHFLSLNTWFRTFHDAGLIVSSIQKINPFITLFNIKNDGTKT